MSNPTWLRRGLVATTGSFLAFLPLLLLLLRPQFLDAFAECHSDLTDIGLLGPTSPPNLEPPLRQLPG
jgi:hypothetical protein